MSTVRRSSGAPSPLDLSKRAINERAKAVENWADEAELDDFFGNKTGATFWIYTHRLSKDVSWPVAKDLLLQARQARLSAGRPHSDTTEWTIADVKDAIALSGRLNGSPDMASPSRPPSPKTSPQPDVQHARTRDDTDAQSTSGAAAGLQIRGTPLPAMDRDGPPLETPTDENRSLSQNSFLATPRPLTRSLASKAIKETPDPNSARAETARTRGRGGGLGEQILRGDDKVDAVQEHSPTARFEALRPPKRRKIESMPMPSPRQLGSPTLSSESAPERRDLFKIDSAEKGGDSSSPQADLAEAPQCLNDGEWVNDSVIEDGLASLSHIRPLTLRHIDCLLVKNGVQLPSRYLDGIDFLTTGKTGVLIPLNMANHWCLGFVGAREGHNGQRPVHIFDSWSNDGYKKRGTALLETFISKAMHVSKKPDSIWSALPAQGVRISHPATPKQSNSFDCGVAVLVFAIYLAAEKSLPGTIDFGFWRAILRVIYASRDRTNDPQIEAGYADDDNTATAWASVFGIATDVDMLLSLPVSSDLPGLGRRVSASPGFLTARAHEQPEFQGVEDLVRWVTAQRSSIQRRLEHAHGIVIDRIESVQDIKAKVEDAAALLEGLLAHSQEQDQLRQEISRHERVLDAYTSAEDSALLVDSGVVAHLTAVQERLSELLTSAERATARTRWTIDVLRRVTDRADGALTTLRDAVDLLK